MQYVIKVCNLNGLELFASAPMGQYQKNGIVDHIRCEDDAITIPLNNGSFVIPKLAVHNYIFHINEVVVLEDDMGYSDEWVGGISSLLSKKDLESFVSVHQGWSVIEWIKANRSQFKTSLKDAKYLYDTYKI